MATVVYVHGTGAREVESKPSFGMIQEKLSNYFSSIIACTWGDEYGAALHCQGKSIPSYDQQRNIDEELSMEELNLLLWSRLYQDPLYEWNLLSLTEHEAQEQPMGRQTFSETLLTQVTLLPNNTVVKQAIEKAQASMVFAEAIGQLLNERTLLSKVADATGSYQQQELYETMARALVAKIIWLSNEQGLNSKVTLDADLRDELVRTIAQALGASDEVTTRNLQAIGKSLGLLALRGGQRAVMPWLMRKRKAISDASFAGVGDILLYQARGEAILGLIKRHILSAHDHDGPVVILAHSLGGVAAVDLLISEDLPVALLITVGSQAPYFYELNALQSLPFEPAQPISSRIPSHFPRWINVYDQRDLLSFVGQGIFGDRVDDIEVNNRQPFPQAHNAYWHNPQLWESIIAKLP